VGAGGLDAIGWFRDRMKFIMGQGTPGTASVHSMLFARGITVILTRILFDERKSRGLRANRNRGIGFEEAEEIFSHLYYLDQRSDWPEQYRAIGWVGQRLCTLIFEMRDDEEGDYYHLVTLWKATREEKQLYEEHS
jgi:uncharacterized DUF497 family protein